jgi:hypothetical protein
MRVIPFVTYLICFVLGIVFLVLLAIKSFAFEGVFEYEYTFGEASPYISMLKPRGRVDQEIYTTDDGMSYQKILHDPVYFDLKLPRKFENLEVEVIYQNFTQSILELGLSAGEELPSFLLKPIEHKILEKLFLSPSWSVIESGEFVLFQKGAEFASIDEFKQSQVSLGEVATYRVDAPFEFQPSNYLAQDDYKSLNKSLRGTHAGFLYVGEGEAIDIVLNLQDANRSIGADKIEFELIDSADEMVWSHTINDDGIRSDNRVMGRPFDYNILFQPERSGVYKLNMRMSDDIFIRSIRLKQQYFVLQDYLYLADNVGYLNERSPERYDATTVYSNVERLSVITAHKEGLQEVLFAGEAINVDQRHLMYSSYIPISKRGGQVTDIFVPNNDIKLHGRGFFALDESMFFSPNPLELLGDESIELDLFGINYVYARYGNRAEKLENGWNRQVISYDLAEIYDKDNSVRFAFSFPQGSGNQADIRVANIKVRGTGQPIGVEAFIQKIINRLKYIFL